MNTKEHLNTDEIKKANTKYGIFGWTALLQKNHDGTEFPIHIFMDII
jgi:hypothetical protein